MLLANDLIFYVISNTESSCYDPFRSKSPMSYEAGSLECRRLVETKENLLKVMQSLSCFHDIEHIQSKLKEIYNELEDMHEKRRKLEKV